MPFNPDQKIYNGKIYCAFWMRCSSWIKMDKKNSLQSPRLGWKLKKNQELRLLLYHFTKVFSMLKIIIQRAKSTKWISDILDIFISSPKPQVDSPRLCKFVFNCKKFLIMTGKYGIKFPIFLTDSLFLRIRKMKCYFQECHCMRKNNLQFFIFGHR